MAFQDLLTKAPEWNPASIPGSRGGLLVGIVDEAQARGSIRLGFGRFTTDGEVDDAVALIRAAADRQVEWA